MNKSLFLFSIFLLTPFITFAAVNLRQGHRQLKKTTNKRLEVMDKKLDELEEKISELSGDSKEAMKEKYEDLLKMKKTLKQRLVDAEESTAATWETAKYRVENYANALEKKIDKAFY